MKKIIGLLLLLIICGCFYKKNSELKDKPPFPETFRIEYENHSFPLYEVKGQLYTLFDSLTKLINYCPKTKNESEVLYVTFNTKEDTLNIMSIDLMRRNDLYCDYIRGIMVNNDRYIILSQTFINDSLFRNTGLAVNFKCRKNDFFRYDIHDWFIGWTYIFYKGGFKCINYDFCGKSWNDKKYYPIDEDK